MTPNRLVSEHEVQPGHSSGAVGRYAAWKFLGLGILLVLMTLVTYRQVNRLPFISIDDGQYVLHNSHIHQSFDLATVKWSFTTFYASNWHPLTWLSHALDIRLFALDPGRHHESNLALHALNALALFWVLWRATGKIGRSFMVAALFALHPVNVESVAWIAERKNLLSMLFLLLALAAYRWYASRPRIDRYAVVAILFALGLMSKPQVVTLPFLLLLWDYWPLKRMCPASDYSSSLSASDEQVPRRSFSWLILEKLPLLALSAVSAIITMKAQRAGGTISGALNSYPFGVRLENAIVAYVQYLGNAIWPTHLAFFYPHSRGLLPAWQVGGAALLLLAITAFCALDRRHRYLLVGWLWFLGTLVPMIGLIQVGTQALADRYAYLSFVGLFLAACWELADLGERWHVPNVLSAGVGLAALLLLSFATYRQVSYWSSDLALWSHATAVTRNNASAENILGETLKRDGEPDAAIIHFRAAAQIDPLFPYPYYHIGIYQEQHGDLRGALQQFQKVIDLTENDSGLLSALRLSTLVRMYSDYATLGDHTNSERYMNMAVQLQQQQQQNAESTRLP